MIVLFITCFVIIVMARVLIDSSASPSVSTAKVVESKGGQCPF